MLTLGSGTLYAAAWYTGGQVQSPTSVGVTSTGTGGALANGTYYVRVSAYTANGESTPTAESSITLSGGGSAQKIAVSWTAPASGPTPSGYRVYIGTVSGYTTAQGTSATTTYNQTASLTTLGAQSWTVGLLSIGEVGGDVELDIQYSEKEFYGQSNFPIAKAFYGGKAMMKAKKVEMNLTNLEAIHSSAQYSTSGTLGSGTDIYGLLNSTTPQPLYLQFVHTRSDAANKTITIEAFKATSKAINFPFMREDITTVEWEFDFLVDSSANANKSNATNLLLMVTATQ